MLQRFASLILCLLTADGSCVARDVTAQATSLPIVRPTPGCAFLPNAIWIHETVLSGGQPAGSDGFLALKKIGVRTIISVDGVTPDVHTASELNLRYVHLPHGYDRISDQRALELAYAVQTLPGPIYIHCHHGRHRSPAAAAVACLTAGLISKEAANRHLLMAGTSVDYEGLIQSVENARRASPQDFAMLDVELCSSVSQPPIVNVMTKMNGTMERLSLIEQAGWKTPARHPDLSPGHEVLMLKEHFTELRRDPFVRDQPAEFQKILNDSRKLTKKLRSLLAKDAPTATTRSAKLTRHLQAVRSNCTRCHRQFRNPPVIEAGG